MNFNKDVLRTCSRCVMDDTDPEITYNDGVCNHCTNFLELIYPSIERHFKNKTLEKLIEQIKQVSKNKPYDCILGISGGADSCYTGYLLKQYGLRVLAVHLDNGWNTQMSVQNIMQVLQKLGFDYESYVLDWEQFKNIQLAFLKASVPEIETPTDIAILAALHQVADKYGIKFIFSGGNYATEGILPRIWHYNAKDLTYFKAIHKAYGKGSLKGFPLFGFRHEFYYKIIKGIKIIYPLNYIFYDRQQAKEILTRELDWKDYGSKHAESRITGFVQTYILPVKFHIDYRKATFSTQICMGILTREEALEKLKILPYNEEELEHEKYYIAKKFELSIDEFEEILRKPPLWYYAYPNNDRFLQFAYKFYRKYFSESLKNNSCLFVG